LVYLVEFGSRQIVDAKPAVTDYSKELIEPDLSKITGFFCAARREAQKESRKNYRIKKILIIRIEGTINENADFVICGSHQLSASTAPFPRCSLVLMARFTAY
jgi:hypothetical protein